MMNYEVKLEQWPYKGTDAIEALERINSERGK